MPICVVYPLAFILLVVDLRGETYFPEGTSKNFCPGATAVDGDTVLVIFRDGYEIDL